MSCFRTLGVIPNEYLYCYNPDAVRRILESPQTRGDFLLETQGRFFTDAAVERERETDPAHLGYAGVALGVMAAISRDERRTMILNVRNRGTIAGLTDDAVVEVPATVDADHAA